MASEIHEIEISRRLSSGSHLFIPPLSWNMATVGSAAHLVHLILSSGRQAKILAHPSWRHLIPDTWPTEVFVYPEELSYDFADRPNWTWLWGLSHSKHHSQELNNFLLGLDSIQILDWTADRVRRRGQFYHDCPYLGGLSELSFIISRELWPVYNWDSPYLGDGLRQYMQQYPMASLDAPLMLMAGQLEFSPNQSFDIPELAELRRHGNWAFQQYKELQAPAQQAMQLKAMELYQKESADHLILALEDEEGCSQIQVITPNVDLELKLRKTLLDKIKKHSKGGFDIDNIDELLACIDAAIELANNQIKKVKPWPASMYVGEHFGFSCSDPQWEFERDQRLLSDEFIEEEAPEEEEEEQVIAKLDWDANQLIQRLRHLKLPPIKLTRRDLVVSHLPVLRLSEDDLRETQDRLEEQRLETLRLRMERMLEDEAERQRQEEKKRELQRLAMEQRRKEEAERREQEKLEAQKQAEEAREKAEQERLEKEAAAKAELEKQEQEAQAKASEAEKLLAAEAAAAQVEAQQLSKEEEQISSSEETKAELPVEVEAEKEEERKDDYLHSGKEGWGADEEEEEKDETEELLESFNQIDRDHPNQEQSFYDEEEKLDDSMGIEHPSHEMFDDEEDEDEEETDYSKDDLEAEQLLAELEEEEDELVEEELEEELEKEDEQIDEKEEPAPLDEDYDKDEELEVEEPEEEKPLAAELDDEEEGSADDKEETDFSKDDLEAEQLLAELEEEEQKDFEDEKAEVFAKASESEEELEELEAEEEVKAEDILAELPQEEESTPEEESKDDYLHSGKDGWGADEEEEEKDETEELLENFQDLDRDHPIEEQNFYDEEENLDDSMGIEHPSHEMFDDEEDEEDHEDFETPQSEDSESADLQEETSPESLETSQVSENIEEVPSSEQVASVSEAEPDEDEIESVKEADEPAMESEEAVEAIEETVSENIDEVPETEEPEVQTEEAQGDSEEASQENLSGAELENEEAVEQEEPESQETQDEDISPEADAAEEPKDESDDLEPEESTEPAELEESPEPEEAIPEDPSVEATESFEAEEEVAEPEESVESSKVDDEDQPAETAEPIEEQEEEPESTEETDQAEPTESVDEDQPDETAEPIEEQEEEANDSAPSAELEEESSETLSPEVILDHLDDYVEIVEDAGDDDDLDAFDEDGSFDELPPEIEEEPSETAAQPEPEPEPQAPEYRFDPVSGFDIPWERDEKPLEKIKKAPKPQQKPVETVEAGLSLPHFSKALKIDKVEAAPPKPQPLKKESAPETQDLQSETPAAAQPEPVQREPYIGRQAPNGYVNPYIYDRHQSVNDLVTEVRQPKRLRKSDFAYVALVAILLVWAHFNQIPLL